MGAAPATMSYAAPQQTYAAPMQYGSASAPVGSVSMAAPMEYAAPMQYAAPTMTYAAPQTFDAPTYAAPQYVVGTAPAQMTQASAFPPHMQAYYDAHGSQFGQGVPLMPTNLQTQGSMVAVLSVAAPAVE